MWQARAARRSTLNSRYRQAGPASKRTFCLGDKWLTRIREVRSQLSDTSRRDGGLSIHLRALRLDPFSSAFFLLVLIAPAWTQTPPPKYSAGVPPYIVSVAPRPFRLFVHRLGSIARRVIFGKGAHNGRPFGRHKTTVVLAYRSVCWRGSKALAG